jgi:hypothetical protein
MGPLSESNRVYNVRHLEGEWRWMGRDEEETCGVAGFKVRQCPPLVRGIHA